MSTRLRKYLTENLLFTLRKVGVSASCPPRNIRMGIDSPVCQEEQAWELFKGQEKGYWSGLVLAVLLW